MADADSHTLELSGDMLMGQHRRDGDSENELREHSRSANGNTDGNNGSSYVRFYERGFYTLLGFVVALLLAWATHSVSKEDLAQAINSHANATAGQVQGMKDTLNVVISNQQEVMSTMSALKTQVAVLSDKLQRGK